MMRRLFAALYDTIGKGSEEAGLREERRQLLAGAEGEVIELGAGTGLNLNLYPEEVTRLVLTEPDRHMRRRLRRRLETLGRPAEIVDASAESLPFPDATFDTAVVTLVLCSVPDQQTALAEIARVLKPEGRLLFLEHVRSTDPKIARRRDRIRPLYNLCGCNPNRRHARGHRSVAVHGRVGQAGRGAEGAQGGAPHDHRHCPPLELPA
jgi:ubiquinone/menaquinone biosynthesis C-methylase UbiE